MKVGYIGNYYKIPEFILHSDFELSYAIIEKGCLSDEMLTFLMVRKIPFCEVKDSNDLTNEIFKTGITTWITCSYGKRIHIEIMEGIEIYNIHFSALPYYKGRHPTFYATLADELSIGISVHKITPKLDDGKIIAQRLVPYYIWENENDIFSKLTSEVPQLLKELFIYLKNKKTYKTFDNKEGFYHYPVSLEDYTINIEKDNPATIYNKVRAQAKYRGALIEWSGVKYWVHSVIFSKNPSSDLLCIPRNGFFILMKVSKVNDQ